jgi:predicted ATP-binding protein involved in virulence
MKEIRRIKITGLFKYLNYDIPFNSGVNILHGVNGKGKTTILNILTNILNGDLKKFYQLSFHEIVVSFTDDDFMRIYRTQEKKGSIIYFDYKIGNDLFEKKDVRKSNSTEALNRKIGLSPLLLPAQRVSLQEAHNHEYEYMRNRMMYEKRYREAEQDIFQPDTKMINISNVKEQLIEKARRFTFHVNQIFSRLDNKLFESFFLQVFSNETPINLNKEETIEIIAEIKKLKDGYLHKYSGSSNTSKILDNLENSLVGSSQINNETISFLKLYKKNIENKKKSIESYLEPFNSFEKIINELFEGKKVSIKLDSTIKSIFSINTQGKDQIEIGHLSSGEKNLILIFYHFLFELKKDTFFMIDEPELSLHIDWQYHIIRYFKEYSNQNQILIVTHSPDILQGYRESEIDLNKCSF